MLFYFSAAAFLAAGFFTLIPLIASSVTYFIPIVAVIFGFFFNEKITAPQIGGMMIALLGVFIANSNRREKSS
jgi:drug/metabolite transporter (DMT)-like permease